jgi:hypothetical protein
MAKPEVLLGACEGIGARSSRQARESVTIRSHFGSSIRQLLSEWRALAEHGALQVDDIHRNHKDEGDADYGVGNKSLEKDAR